MVTFGCTVLVAVTTYSHNLLLDTHRENEQAAHVLQPELIADMPADPGVGLSLDCWVSAR